MLVSQNKQRTIPDDNPFLLGMGGWALVIKPTEEGPGLLRNSHFGSIYGIKRRAKRATLSVNLKILTHTDT